MDATPEERTPTPRGGPGRRVRQPLSPRQYALIFRGFLVGWAVTLAAGLFLWMAGIPERWAPPVLVAESAIFGAVAWWAARRGSL